MKHIVLLATGGTIASEKGEDGLTPGLTGEDMIRLIPQLSGLCRITCKEIMNLDSTNVQPEEWQIMAREACDALQACDGVVITHGTDTMAYSAAALSFMLRDLQKPVIFTGSQIAISQPDTDGKRNILDAVKAALTGIPGVYIAFGGKIILGTRAKKMYTKNLQAFSSINAPDVKLPKSPLPSAQPPSLRSDLDTRVALFKLVPGFSPKLLEAAVSLGYRGILLEAFGSGGVPCHRRDLLPVIQKAVSMGIAVVIATQCEYDGADLSVYEVGVKALKAGAISAKDMTPETAAVKLMWALGQTQNLTEITMLMHTCIVGELQ